MLASSSMSAATPSAPSAASSCAASEDGSRVIARTAKPPSGSARIARARPPPWAPVAPTTAITFLSAMCSPWWVRGSETRADGVRDALRAGQEGVLQRRAVGDGRVGRGDAPGVVDVAEPLLGDDGEHLARPAPGPRTLLDDRDPVGLRERREDRGAVERADRLQV